MIEFITRNIWWKLFALLIAILLWAAVANEPEVSAFVSVPVEFKDLPESVEISSEVVEKVELEMSGPSSELRSFSGNKTAVVLDLSGAAPGERTYRIHEGELHLPRSLRLIRAIPPQVRFVFENHRERAVPVEVRWSGSPASFEVTPRSVIIEGPESRVKRINSVVTDRIDATKLTGVVTFHVTTFAEDPYVRIKSGAEVTVTVTGAGPTATSQNPKQPS